jgi:hypothetical protein
MKGKTMNFSNFTTENFTGVKETSTGTYAVIVHNIVLWEGATTKEAAEARLNDYVS